MRARSHKRDLSKQERPKVRWRAKLFLLLWSALVSAVWAADFITLCADRAAIERVYYNHRLGEKSPFEQVLPPAALEKMVQQDLRKEAALKRTYSVEVTPSMLDAEVQRINTTTRAPEMLAGIKTALGHDPARFANVFAKPILVERLLRERFDNDDALHANQRRQMELVRTQLTNVAAAFRSSRGNEALTKESEIDRSRLTSAATTGVVEKLVAILKRSHSNDVSETTWQLGARPAETNAPDADEIEIKKRFGSNAQILSSPARGGEERKPYFEDLPPELQKVLRVQLRQPGDVSALIEMPGGFLLYLAREKTSETLSAVILSISKRSYEQWLNEQSQSKP